MQIIRRQIEQYVTVEGRCPFREWFSSLRDEKAKDRIRARLTRVELGNLGDYKSVGHGMYELRFSFGPGYRIYFGQIKNVILLLRGGEKGSQDKDIEKAYLYWIDYGRRSHETK